MVGSSVVAESLKPVKLLATCKRTQQLPTTLYEVFGSNAMATKLWKELQISLSIKVRGAHPGLRVEPRERNSSLLFCIPRFSSFCVSHVSVDIKS